MKRLFAWFIVFFMGLGVAHADDKLISLEVVISQRVDESVGVSQNAKTQQKVLEETRDRLEKRLDAAQVKHSELELTREGTIDVRIRPKHPTGWYTSLIVSPGMLTIRELRPGAIAWPQLTSILGKSIEIRGERGADEYTYLWSPTRKPLEEVVSRVHLPGLQVVLAPVKEGGWRTYTAAIRLADQDEIVEVKRQVSPVGAPYITLVFAKALANRLAAPPRSNVKRWGVILDGEVLGLAQTSALRTRRIELTAPDPAGTRDAQKAWAAQVTGRLAATIPLPIAVLEE